jgi:small subunit ribosomal protein S1
MKHPRNLDIVFGDETTAAQDTSFGDLLTQYEQEHRGEGERQTLEGTVVTIHDEVVFVDIGRKTEGILPADGLRDETGKITVKTGDILLVNVLRRNEEGYYELSTVHIERPKDWSGLEAAFAEGRVISGTVNEVVKGGLRVDVGTRAFMPASRSGARDIPEMEKLIGQEICCRITKLDAANEDVVVDRRVVLEEEEKQRRENAFHAVHEGAVLGGTVRSLTDYGAFVDIGGVDGLLHVADISWARVAKPADVLKPGDHVEVKVLKVNPDTRKISLGMKQLQADPWSLAAQKYQMGDRVRGVVSRLTDFGAFIALEPGIDGLIHISEMSWSKKVRKPSDVLSPGEAVEVVVLGVNAAERRISLGLKQALGDPWEEAQKKYPVGAVVEAPITNLANFGAFVDLGDGIEGMIHVGDITREKRLDHPRELLKTGQIVRAQVLEVDRERRRIRLGMKQLEPTSIDTYIAEHQPGETVTGRVMEVKNDRLKVELGEGVVALCRLVGPEERPVKISNGERADISALTAKLTARWKHGAPDQSAPDQAVAKAGQIRTFKIASLDPEQKKINLELIK